MRRTYLTHFDYAVYEAARTWFQTHRSGPSVRDLAQIVGHGSSSQINAAVDKLVRAHLLTQETDGRGHRLARGLYLVPDGELKRASQEALEMIGEYLKSRPWSEFYIGKAADAAKGQ